MKKVISLLLIYLIFFSALSLVYADEPSWQSDMKKIILSSQGSNFTLMDVSGDGIPELFAPGGNGVVSYHFDGNSVVQASSDATIPYEFVMRLSSFRDNSNRQHYMGQTMFSGEIITYKMSFLNCAPVLEILARENPKTGKGEFKGDASSFDALDDVEQKVSDYLNSYLKEYILKTTMTIDEVRKCGKRNASSNLFERYALLSDFSDNTSLFTTNQREKIKKSVGKGNFLGFDRLTILNDDVIFVEYFLNNSLNSDFAFAHEKIYSLISGDFNLIKTYEKEYQLDTDYLYSLISPDAKPSNIRPDYEKTASFRGIDDYVNYFSSLLSSGDEINENGKKEIASFMEYAANKCSRAEIKANDNVLYITQSNVSIISQNATNSMSQLQSVCKTKGIEQIRTAKTVPELVAKDLDFTKPIRCEFGNGVSQKLASASGIRIMISDNLGIYINSAELSVLENEYNIFAVEFTKNDSDYSIVFTDKTNKIISEISVPVWFIVPSHGDYSSVLASFDGGIENRGGQFDGRNATIEFSATRSGNYQVIEKDITINDIDAVPFSANQAIRFLVSKGVLTVDKNNNFHPNSNMNRYDFTKALVSMFYASDKNAVCSYPDVSQKNSYYPFVATAEAMGMAKAMPDGNFCGAEAVTNEYVLSVCGKVLAEKKGYKFPDNYVDYLTFSDKTEISASAMPYIAVATQCGLTENSGDLLPNDTVTREKGAQILYKTFTLLYDTSPVTTSFSAVVEDGGNQNVINDLTPLERAVICLVLTLVLALSFYLLCKKRKPYEK